MANAYWLGAFDGTTWSNSGNWSSDSSGTATPATPPGFGDIAYFSASTVSASQSVSIGASTYFVGDLDVLGTQTSLVTIIGSGTLGAANIYARAGSGGLTVSTSGVDTNTLVRNESSSPITFTNAVFPSFHPTIQATGSGGITFSGGINLSGVAPGFQYVTVNSSGSGVTTFETVANTADGFFVTAGIAAITTAGSTAVTVSAGAAIRLGTGTQTGTISGAGTLAKTTAGTLTLPSSSTHGATAVTAGTVAFASGALGSGNTTVNGGTLLWSAGNTQDISGALALQNGGTATLNTGANNVTFASSIGSSSSSAVAKAGSGTLTLSAASTHSGGTTVSQGTVKTGNVTSLGSGPVSVASGSTLQIGTAASGKATLSGTLTINGGTLRIGG